MKKIYEQEEILKKLENCNFVAYAATPWHAHGVDCIITDLQSKNINLKGIIVIVPTIADSEDFLISEYNFKCKTATDIDIIYGKFHMVKEHYVTLFFQQLKYCLKPDTKKEICYLVNPGMPQYDMARLIERSLSVSVYHIIIDEGLATYMGQASDFSIFEKKTYVPKIKQIVRKFFVYLINITKKNLRYETIFIGKIGCLQRNERVIQNYKKFFENSLMNELSYENKVVIITQPFQELGEIKGSIDVEIIKKTIETLKKKGYESSDIVIKMHPKEKSIEKYNMLDCVIEKKQTGSFEEILARCKNKPDVVIGFTSTALVTAHLFWGIPTYSLCNYLQGAGITNELFGITQKFKSGFHRFVCIVKNYDDLIC